MNDHISHESMSEWVDGQLDAKESERLAEHVRTCEECRSVYAEMAAVTNLFREAESIQPPAGLWTRIADELEAAQHVEPITPTPAVARAYTLRSWLQLRAWVPVSALILASVLGGSLVLTEYRAHVRLRSFEMSEIDRVQDFLLASNIKSSNPFRLPAASDLKSNPFSQKEFDKAPNPFRPVIEGGRTESKR